MPIYIINNYWNKIYIDLIYLSVINYVVSLKLNNLT